VLLVAAGLFLRTLDKLWTQDTGYDRHNVLMFSVDARLAGQTGARVGETYRRLLEELRGVPGAQSVSASVVRPVSLDMYLIDRVSHIDERQLTREHQIRVAFNLVAPDYFRTVGIRLLAGRDFDRRDSAGAPRVVIVSERMARHFTGNPVGQRIGTGPNAAEVVGVVSDIRHARVKDAPREILYYPLFQDFRFIPSFAVRYAGSPADVLEASRAAVARTDQALSLFKVRTLEAQTDDSFARERLLALLTTYIGGFAVLLACIGIYGLMSYMVTQRTGEIGVRMALGAQPATVRWLIVRNAAVTVTAGAVAGVVAASGAVRLVRGLLYGIEPTDPVAYAGATLVLAAMAFIAAYLPARRASRIDPLAALRHE
jgi:predicted permease